MEAIRPLSENSNDLRGRLGSSTHQLEHQAVVPCQHREPDGHVLDVHLHLPLRQAAQRRDARAVRHHQGHLQRQEERQHIHLVRTDPGHRHRALLLRPDRHHRHVRRGQLQRGHGVRHLPKNDANWDSFDSSSPLIG